MAVLRTCITMMALLKSAMASRSPMYQVIEGQAPTLNPSMK